MSSTTAKPRLPSIPTGYAFTLLIASSVAAWRLPDVVSRAAAMTALTSTSDGVSVAMDALPLVLTLLPFLVAAAAWRTIPHGMRTGVLGILALLAAPTAYRAAGYAEWMVRDAVEMRLVAADLAPIRAAMRVPPEEAARRAVEAGNPEFLGISNVGMFIPGVENDCVERNQGWWLVREMGDAVRSAGHLRFQLDATAYATRYNAAVVRLVGLDPAEAARPVDECPYAPVQFSGDTPYWPDGGLPAADARRDDERE
jgi:multisubunit Na+/H+ antiporter MnhG subunit